MQDKKVDELIVDEKFERLTPASKEEFKALENMIVADGDQRQSFLPSGDN